MLYEMIIMSSTSQLYCQTNKKVLKVVEHVMRNEAVYGIDRFPPACMGIFHQPKRPIIQKKSER